MRIAIFGVGGVGGYFGGRLAQAGEDVIFIARGAHLEAIRKNGLKVESAKGNFTIQPAQAESDPAATGKVDAVLLGVKAWQVPEAAEKMRPMIGSDTIVIPLQNGVDAPAQLAAALDRSGDDRPHALGGLCRISSKVAAPGVIAHVGIEPYIAFNRMDGQADERVERLLQAFKRAEVNAEVPADILSEMWGKFLFIVASSGLGAITRAPVGVVRSTPETRRLLEMTISECEAVGRAQGIALPKDIVAMILQFIDNMPTGSTPSMQRDVMEGRPSELESQTGALVRMGRACGVSTPINEFIYACLLPQEKAARGEK